MTMTMTKSDIFNTLNIRQTCPDGTAYIQILEEEPGKIHKIIFQIGKAGSSINSYCYAIAELSTELLRSGYSITDLIELLLDITSDRAPRLEVNGPQNKSGAEALASALRMYLQSTEPNENERKVARFTKLK